MSSRGIHALPEEGSRLDGSRYCRAEVGLENSGIRYLLHSRDKDYGS